MRKLLVCVLMLVSMAALFALDGLVTWTWFENDPEVEFYRYQVDGEDDSGWTVVDTSVNEVTLKLDVSEPHVLYLQQSYDGENWSESSMVDSEIFTTFDEPVAEESGDDSEATDQNPAGQAVETDSDEEESAVQAEASAEEKQPETERYLPLRSLDYGIGYLNSIPDPAEPKMLGAFASYSRTFMKADIFHIGVKFNGSVYSSIRDFRPVSYLNVLAIANVVIGNSDVYIGFGPDVGFNYIKDSSVKGGLSVEIGVRYHRSPKIALGFALADHYYLIPSDGTANRFDVRIFMGSVL